MTAFKYTVHMLAFMLVQAVPLVIYTLKFSV